MSTSKAAKGRPAGPACAICRKPLRAHEPKAKAKTGKTCHARCLSQAVRAGKGNAKPAPGKQQPAKPRTVTTDPWGAPPKGPGPARELAPTGRTGTALSRRKRGPLPADLQVAHFDTPAEAWQSPGSSPFRQAAGEDPICPICDKPRGPRQKAAPAPDGGWAHADCVPDHDWNADRAAAASTRSQKPSTWRLGGSPSSVRTTR